MATLAKLLQAEMTLPEMARKLAAAGRGKDSILANINPKEAALLKSQGGRGKPNPETGIIEFDETGEGDAISYAQAQPVPEAAAPTGSKYGQEYGQDVVDTTPSVATFGADQYATPTAPAIAPAQTAAPAATPSFAQAQPIDISQISPTAPGMEQGTQIAAEAPAKSFQQTLAEGGSKLATQLGPLGFLKVGGGLAAALAGRKAAGQVSQQAAANEAEIRKLADPYRQQGQQLLNLGQAGQLTAPQQQALEAQRAAVQQQLAQSGVTGGTAQMQAEQAISRVAQQYAQDNISRGVALMGTADKYITDAIQAGYTGAKDAATLTKDFYSQIASMLPTTAGGPAVAPKG